LWLTQTKKDWVQPGVPRHDVTKALLSVAEEFRGQGRTPSFSVILCGRLSAETLGRGSGYRWRKCSGGIVGCAGAEDDHQHGRSISEAGGWQALKCGART